MNTREVADRFGVALITVQKWAAANGVKYTGEGRHKTFVWTEKDCKRFAARPGKGWVKGRPRKVD
jgi:predicted site-specific integrase-resolvase